MVALIDSGCFYCSGVLPLPVELLTATPQVGVGIGMAALFLVGSACAGLFLALKSKRPTGGYAVVPMGRTTPS